MKSILNAIWKRRGFRVKTKTRPVDWIMIQWARVCEEELKPDVSELDSIAPDDRDEFGRMTDPLSYLSARAERLLTFTETPVRQWLHRAKRFRYFATFLVVALGALAFPLARVNTILGDDVNLAGSFLFFLSTQIFFLTVALVLATFVILTSFVRRLLGRSRNISFFEKAIQYLSCIVGSIATYLFHRYAPYFFSLFGKSTTGRFAWHAQSSASRREKEENPLVAQDVERRQLLSHHSHLLFWDVLFSKPRVVAFWSCVLSHAFWAFCSICVLFILMARMQGNRFDYCWRTSLEDERAVKYGVDVLGTPIAALGGTVPSSSDVAALFDDELVAPSLLSQVGESGSIAQRGARQTAAEIRARWSYFLLSIVFIWCILPRLLLVGIYYLLYRNALRDFRPSLEDEFYRSLMERAERYCSTTRALLVEAPEDDAEFEETPISAPVAPNWKSSSSILSEPSESLSTADDKDRLDKLPSEANETLAETKEAPQLLIGQSETRRESCEEDSLAQALASVGGLPDSLFKTSDLEPRRVLAFGYDFLIAPELIGELFDGNAEVSLYNDVADFDEKKRLVEYLGTYGESVTQCVIFTDVGLPPARHFIRFLRDVLTPKLGGSEILVVLSGSERLRRKFATSPTGVAERLEDWQKTLAAVSQASGKSWVPILYYDAELNLPEPRERLRRQLLGTELGEKRGEAPRDLSKWNFASKLILTECRDVFEASTFVSSDDADRLRVGRICGEIFKIYHSEVAQASRLESTTSIFSKKSFEEIMGHEFSSRFGDAAAAVSSTAGKTLERRAEELGLTNEFFESRIMAAYSLSSRMRALSGKLSPKCALVAASVGLSVPAMVALSPLLGGAVTASTLLATVSALGAAIPSSLASGAVAGALGALAPESLRVCKRKLIDRLFGSSGDKAVSESSSDVADDSATALEERSSSVALLTYSSTMWAVTLELQGLPEDVIVSLLPQVLRSVDESHFETLAAVESALEGVRRELENVPKE